MIEKLPESIKILTHNAYGMYGFSIPQAVVDFVERAGGKEAVDYWFDDGYGDGYSKKYIRSERHGESRVNPLLIAAFEAYLEYIEGKEYHSFEEENAERCKYKVNTLWLNVEIEDLDGYESAPVVSYGP